MYRIRELPVLRDEAHRAIAYAAEYSDPPGIRTISGNGSISSRAWASTLSFLPSVCARQPMPETRLTGHDEWSAVSVFRKVWRRERALRAAEATRNREWNQLVIPDGMSNQ